MIQIPGLTEAQTETFAQRLVKREGVDPNQLERLLAAGIGWLQLCAAYPTEVFAPPMVLDTKFWHPFALHTQWYGQICRALTGGHGFIHHNPSDAPETEAYRRTLAFMREHGIAFDPDFWPEPEMSTAAECGCSNSECLNVSCSECDGETTDGH